jgi:hypothetical protein
MTIAKFKKSFMLGFEAFLSSLTELFYLLPQEQFLSNAIARCRVPYGKEEQSLYSDQKNKVFEMTIGGIDSIWSKMQAKRLERQRQEEARVQRDADQMLEETVASTSQINDAIEPEGDIEVLQDEYEWHAPGTGMETQKVIMTRQRQKHLDACGEVPLVSKNEWKVRD